MTKGQATKRFWAWVDSPSYWKSATIITAIFLTIAAFGKTVDWMFAASMLWGFYLCWKFSAKATKAAIRMTIEQLREENT
jgi:hypothetical protein